MRYAHRQNHVPSHGFFDDCVDVDEVVRVGMVRKPTGANDGVQIGLGSLLNVGIQGHREAERFKCVAGLPKNPGVRYSNLGADFETYCIGTAYRAHLVR